VKNLAQAMRPSTVDPNIRRVRRYPRLRAELSSLKGDPRPMPSYNEVGVGFDLDMSTAEIARIISLSLRACKPRVRPRAGHRPRGRRTRRVRASVRARDGDDPGGDPPGSRSGPFLGPGHRRVGGVS